LKGMVMTGRKICQDRNCFEVANYGLPGQKPLFCKDHKLQGMEYYIKNPPRLCSEEGCTELAGWNYEGKKTALVCVDHRVEGMVNVRGARCEFPSCEKLARFNDDGKGPHPRFCKLHMAPTMVCVLNQQFCQVPGCQRVGLNGFEADRNVLWCDLHSSEEMVQLKKLKARVVLPSQVVVKTEASEICEVHACDRRPEFDYDASLAGRMCEFHKMPGMVRTTFSLEKVKTEPPDSQEEENSLVAKV